MATKKFDRICKDFVARIPTEFKADFVPGTMAMPDTYFGKLTADVVSNYVNRAMQKVFNDYWTMFAEKLDDPLKQMIKTFPELVKLSGDVNRDDYVIASPHLDFYKIIGAVANTTPNKTYIKIWDEHKYTLALTQEYEEYVATDENPAIIQIQNKLYYFPIASGGGGVTKMNFHYLSVPVAPTTGGFLTQNEGTDSPYFDHWNKIIADEAYLMFLQESNQTT